MNDDERITTYLTRPYNRIFTREEDGRFSASVLEWPGCYGDGDTAEGANASLEASMATWVSVMLDDGNPIPEPTAREFSGRMLLRLPKQTHRNVALRAGVEGVSANQLVLSFIESGLARGSWPTTSVAVAGVGMAGASAVISPGWIYLPADPARDLFSAYTSEVDKGPANVGQVRLSEHFPLRKPAGRDTVKVPAGQGARRG